MAPTPNVQNVLSERLSLHSVCILCPSFPYLTTFINLVYFSLAIYVHSFNTGKLWTLFFAYSLKSL